jgi:hypothetical protein
MSEREILKKLEDVHREPFESFIEKMKEVSSYSKEYVQKKSDECSGIYSSYVINEKGEKIIQKKKLTKKEKNLCLYSLVNFRIQITKTAYKARFNHLKALQEQQRIELLALEKKRIGELQLLANKYK